MCKHNGYHEAAAGSSASLISFGLHMLLLFFPATPESPCLLIWSAVSLVGHRFLQLIPAWYCSTFLGCTTADIDSILYCLSREGNWYASELGEEASY